MRLKRRLTPAIAARIKWLAINRPDLFRDQIAAEVNQNPGRVSEVLNGQRYPEVTPAP